MCLVFFVEIYAAQLTVFFPAFFHKLNSCWVTFWVIMKNFPQPTVANLSADRLSTVAHLPWVIWQLTVGQLSAKCWRSVHKILFEIVVNAALLIILNDCLKRILLALILPILCQQISPQFILKSSLLLRLPYCESRSTIAPISPKAFCTFRCFSLRKQSTFHEVAT